MIKVNVDKAISAIKKNFSNLDGEQVAKAAMRAINKTLLKGRTTARAAVKGKYNIPQKNLSGINKKDSSRSLLIGYITASAKPIPMDAFAPKFETSTGSLSVSKKGEQKSKLFKKAKSNAAKGVSIEVIKGSRQIVDYAFMIRGGKPRVFARGAYKAGGSWGFIQRSKRVNKTGADTPIKPLISITVHGAVINNKVEQQIASDIEPYFSQRLQHELEYQVNKMKDQ